MWAEPRVNHSVTFSPRRDRVWRTPASTGRLQLPSRTGPDKRKPNSRRCSIETRSESNSPSTHSTWALKLTPLIRPIASPRSARPAPNCCAPESSTSIGPTERRRIASR